MSIDVRAIYGDVNMPSTIRHPAKFNAAKPAGFDGIFDWSWTDGCFGKTRISPMDFDGVVERNGHLLVFETKDVGKDVPQGQLITLEALWRRSGVTVFLIHGKARPEDATVWQPRLAHDRRPRSQYHIGLDAITEAVRFWYAKADHESLRHRVDFDGQYQRRVLHLENTVTAVERRLSETRDTLHAEIDQLVAAGRIGRNHADTLKRKVSQELWQLELRCDAE
jgi:hypothetical protein